MNRIKQAAGKLAGVLRPFGGPLVLWAFCAFLLVMFVTLQTSVWAVLRAAVYYPLGLLLPGYLLARNAAGKDRAGELYGFSLFFGMTLAITAYFLDSYIRLPLLPGRFFCCLLGPVLSVPGFLLLLRDLRTGKRDRASLRPDGKILTVAAVAVVIALGTGALYSALPTQTVNKIETPHSDIVRNIAHMASLERGWPADNIQYLGKPYRTDLFANVFRVAAGRFIGAASQAEMMYVFSCLFLVPLLVFALDAVGQVFLNGDRRRSLVFVCVCLFTGYASRAVLFFYNIPWAYAAAYRAGLQDGMANLLYAPNGTDLAVPGFLLLFLLIRKLFREKEKPSAGICAVTLVAAAAVTGAKHAAVYCAAGGIAVTAAGLAVRDRRVRSAAKALLPLLLVAAGFLPVYFGLVRDSGEVRLPPSNSAAVYMTSEDPDYITARQQFQAKLDRNTWFYYVFTPEAGSPEPVVRQKTDRDYFIYGKGLVRTRREREELQEVMDRALDIRAEGLLDGAGGYYDPEADRDTMVCITGARGFIRYTDAESGLPAVLFYGPGSTMKYRDVDVEAALLAEGMNVTGMFTAGGNGTETDYVPAAGIFSVNAAVKDTEVYGYLVNGTKVEQTGWLTVLLILLIPVHFLLTRPVTAVPFCLWIREKIKGIRTAPAEDLLAGGAALCGLAAFYLLSTDEGGQKLFLETVIPLADAAGICWLYAHRSKMSGYAKKLLCLAVALGIGTGWSLYAYRFRDGFNKAQTVQTAAYMRDAATGSNITRYEREAMDWLRENTPRDAVVATNRHYQDSGRQLYYQPRPKETNTRYYYYAAYGERQMFLGTWANMPRTQQMQQMLRERLAVNDALFSPLCANRREIMEANGISYLIASTEAGRSTDLPDRDLECVFLNRDIAIYALKGSRE